ncbi:MAG: pyruvate, phosphate dikinase [Proteobacteria bacterium]|nr:pyruvate, phosphate dikinase [Pseudomonadota bacterium]
MKRIYSFGGGTAEGSAADKNLLGGKGANLAEMSSLGLPVPPGFTLTAELCMDYLDSLGGTGFGTPPDGPLPDGLIEEVDSAMATVEEILGKRFGATENPLLVSVRSGGRVSMPGMMDTVLNLGLNDETVAGLAALSGDERFAWDSYRRFVTMYSDVVLGLHRARLEALVNDLKRTKGITADVDITADDWKTVVPKMKERVRDSLGCEFPETPADQLREAIKAVFRSWNTARARFYRKEHGIDDRWGTAVNVQAMVFGNMGDDSATGVAFTRDPKDGKDVFFGEFLVNAQGEDVVAGLRTPQPINRDAGGDASLPTLQEVMPEAYDQLDAMQKTLESHYRDMQDIEFTIEKGSLFILQTRRGKRTGAAAVRIAVDMADAGIIDRAEALGRVNEEHLNQLLHPSVAPGADKTIIAKGLPASPGAATGRVVFTAEKAVEWAERGPVILVREETSPEDIEGMAAAVGILTQRGGQTSHAAVVARGMGRCCVVGCSDIAVHRDGSFLARPREQAGKEWTIRQGDIVTLDGSTGEVMLGEVDMSEADLASSGLETILGWADAAARLGVRANADTPGDAKTARDFGATGIGLCRTEHMFFEGDRITAVREMILAETPEETIRALDKLYPMQRDDFVGIFEAMDGLPVTIRLLDPPLHEFLPHDDSEIQSVAAAMHVPVSRIREQVENLREFNPMMGHRGCRLGITHPQLYRMQTRAILDAALDVKAHGGTVEPEIMIPLVGVARELELLRGVVLDEASTVFERRGESIEFRVGTMIELPRACLTADRIAAHADFFSFGTNDLTQTTFGYSRDDARFLQTYEDPAVGVLPGDPFVSIDVDGVGTLVMTGTRLGRSVKPNLKVGICGEHGGDPRSIAFVHGVGLDYVSCSPFRVPIARLAAGQAALGDVSA